MADIVHLIKLSVGSESVEGLEAWQRARFGAGPARHVTRMWPKREAALLAGGSLYWVIGGLVLARQRIEGLEAVTGEDGIRRCAILLRQGLFRTAVVPRRPFQGWRYLSVDEAPRDLAPGAAREEALPPSLSMAMAEIGLR